MAKNEKSSPDMTDLRQMLDTLRAETPDVPEDFRAAWREAVRKEAAGREKPTEPATEPEAPARTNRTAAFPTGNRLFWRRGMSVAAAAVLLLGGTLLGWDAVHFARLERETAPAAEMRTAAVPADARELASTASPALGAAAVPAATAMPSLKTAVREDAAAPEDAREAAATASPVPEMFAAPAASREEADTAMDSFLACEAAESVSMYMEAPEEAAEEPLAESEESAAFANDVLEEMKVEAAGSLAPDSSPTRPLRTAGLLLAGLGLLLAACAWFFRK